MDDTINTIALVVFGVMIGSFINAFTWRWRQTRDDDGNKIKLSKKKAAELSIATGRSMCPHCKHQLQSYDLVPIGSWLSLKGRCRYCKAKIGVQYPFVEALTGTLFGLTYVWWPYGFSALGWVQFACWLVLVGGFVALAIYDLRWLLLPFKMLYPLIAIAMLMIIARAIDTQDFGVLVNSIAAAAVLGGLFYGLHTVSKGKWIGGGDVVAAPMLGLLAGGLGEVFLLLFGASVIGIVAGIPMLVRKKDKKVQIPFGPMLFIATYFVVLFGSQVVDWYFDMLLV